MRRTWCRPSWRRTVTTTGSPAEASPFPAASRFASWPLRARYYGYAGTPASPPLSKAIWPGRGAARRPYCRIDLAMTGSHRFLDPARHKAYTGVSNTPVLANARRLAETHIPLIVRTSR